MENKKVAGCVITNNPDDVISLKRFADRQKGLESKYNVLVLLGENIDKKYELLFKYNDNCEVRGVPDIQLNRTGRYKSTIMKITALLQTDYDLLCFIETDTIILKNIDGVIDENIDAELPHNFLFFTDLVGLEEANHIQGLSFFMKPNVEIYNEIIEGLKICPNQIVDESVLTEYFENKGIHIPDLFCPIDFSARFISNNIIHFPGLFKPGRYDIPVLDNLYYSSSPTEFNKFIDNNNNLKGILLLERINKIMYRTMPDYLFQFDGDIIKNELEDAIALINHYTKEQNSEQLSI